MPVRCWPAARCSPEPPSPSVKLSISTTSAVFSCCGALWCTVLPSQPPSPWPISCRCSTTPSKAGLSESSVVIFVESIPRLNAFCWMFPPPFAACLAICSANVSAAPINTSRVRRFHLGNSSLCFSRYRETVDGATLCRVAISVIAFPAFKSSTIAARVAGGICCPCLPILAKPCPSLPHIAKPSTHHRAVCKSKKSKKNFPNSAPKK